MPDHQAVPSPLPHPHSPLRTLSSELHPRHGQQLHLTVILGHIGGEGGAAYKRFEKCHFTPGAGILWQNGANSAYSLSCVAFKTRMSLKIVFNG